jgi:hypothetical protein
VLANNGWFVPPPDIADYGTDYQNGAHDYRIHFAAGHLPPARYFWSLTNYNQAFFLVRNPINRYEIGNRSPGLRYNADGSLDVYLQRSTPTGHQANWLPSPAGTFEVTLRLYGPRATALNRTYVYPAITKLR